MRNFIFIICLIITSNLFSQEVDFEKYKFYCAKADSFLSKKEYQAAVEFYSKGFQQNNWKGTVNQRYYASIANAQIGNIDSAFYHLNKIHDKYGITDTNKLLTDNQFITLYKDERWTKLYDDVKQKQKIREANYDHGLITKLHSIFVLDQQYRRQLDSLSRAGVKSKQVKQLIKKMNETDKSNLEFIDSLLGSRGWLGKEIVGEEGSMTLFLVIQHADLKTQEKYLPIMRDAALNGKTKGSWLALLEDRIEISKGKPQVYGSQIGELPDGTSYLIATIEPDKLDERRKAVGLNPISEYVSRFGIVWNLEEYKKSLPKLLKLL